MKTSLTFASALGYTRSYKLTGTAQCEADMTGLRKSDYKFFDEARRMALKSGYPNFRIGCVIVYKGRIVGAGSNSTKTCPQQKYYNRRYRHFNRGTKPISDTLHAEIAALRSIPHAVEQTIDWRKVRVYIYRISVGKQNGYGLARCCPGCMNALKDKGIRHILYTTDDGLCYEEIQ